ncbi:MAG: imidazole glycerol phosphate synthase subunit HisH [Gammaproteobacteria bacterium]|nr:imidazole glycerol phosphate synthase subunit HisH [Gammaproteobacteria bacterium]
MIHVAVIDYGMGNLHSVAKALQHAPVATRIEVTHDHRVIRQADHVVLPGVGAIRDCMGEIRRLGIDKIVAEVVDQGTPLLAVCVGLQALMRFSEENQGVAGLNLLPGDVKFFGATLSGAGNGERLKVPHMGWNQVAQVADHPLWRGIVPNSRFYFVHSYYVQADSPDLVAGRCVYGIPFAAALARANIFAVQFHPEKSQRAGLTLYENFLAWDGRV